MSGRRRGAASAGAAPRQPVPAAGAVRLAGQGAQATVELALLLPVVALLLATLLQAAAVGRDALLVTHAAREAARAAAVDPDPGAGRRAALEAGGLDPERLEVRVTGGGEPGSRVRAEVRYRLRGHLPVVGAILADRTLSARATMRVEYSRFVGRGDP